MKIRFENLIESRTGDVVELDVPYDNTPEQIELTRKIRNRASAFGKRCKEIREQRIAEGTFYR